MTTDIKYCALPECGKPFYNWRSFCCCKSHQGKYSAKLRYGTLDKPNVTKEELKEKSKSRKEFNKTFIGPKKPRIYNKSPVQKIKRKAEPRDTEENKAKWVSYLINCRKKRDKSMPGWANKDAILEFYKEARRLTLETGISHQVDHIIPSNHKLVCGLHNEFNLQVITREENQKKNNKFEIL